MADAKPVFDMPAMPVRGKAVAGLPIQPELPPPSPPGSASEGTSGADDDRGGAGNRQRSVGAGQAPAQRGRPRQLTADSIAETESQPEVGNLHVQLRAESLVALRIAAATKKDPRGRTLNAIIQSLLDENGYCDPKFSRDRSE